jgi:hypothetical protein
MKILLAVVMSLTVVSSVWAACSESTLTECTTESDCTDAKKGNGSWKPADSGTTVEADKVAHCAVKVAPPQQKGSVCDQVDGSTKVKDAPAAVAPTGQASGTVIKH